MGYPGPKLKADNEDQDALDFCQQMHELDQKLIAAVDKAHQSMKSKYDKNCRSDSKGATYQPKQKVWVLRPRKKPVAGDVKLDTVWCGPYEIVKCTGKHSYDVRMGGTVRSQHVDRMKAYHSDHLGRDVPLEWTTVTKQEDEELDDTFDVDRVIRSKQNPDGSKSYLVKWKGYKQTTWEPWNVFFPQVNDEFIDFLAKSKEQLDLREVLKKTPHWPVKA